MVAYVHGFEIDRPFLVLEQGGHDLLPFTRTDGRITTGACPTTRCVETDVEFPMGRSDLFGAPHGVRDRATWYGSLIVGLVDGSGYIYQRNRYLDPSTGMFTQVDPIGLAGGLNVYGFANGDPVNHSDPFGLCVAIAIPICPQILAALAAAGAATAAWRATKQLTTIDLPAWFSSDSKPDDDVQPEELPAPATPANPDQSKKEPGQQYEEVSDAQRKARQRGQPDKINS